MIPANPAASVRGPRHSAIKGKTPVLDAAEARQRIVGVAAKAQAPEIAARLSSSLRRHLDARLLPPHPEGFGTGMPVLHSGHQVSPRTEVAVDHRVG